MRYPCALEKSSRVPSQITIKDGDILQTVLFCNLLHVLPIFFSQLLHQQYRAIWTHHQTMSLTSLQHTWSSSPRVGAGFPLLPRTPSRAGDQTTGHTFPLHAYPKATPRSRLDSEMTAVDQGVSTSFENPALLTAAHSLAKNRSLAKFQVILLYVLVLAIVR